MKSETAKHTPGPWRIEEDEFGFAVHGKKTATYTVYICEQIDAEPDAHLIAAAPELLEALKGMRKAFDAAHNHTQAVAQDIADGAIRKVEGEL